MSDTNTSHGTLKFETRFHSVELGQLELPVEVRKPDLTIVTNALTSQIVPLEAGQYVITTRLPAGQQLHSIARVTAGNETAVVLEPNSFESSPSETMEVQHFLRRSVRKRPTRSNDPSATSFAEMAPLVAVAATVNNLKIRWFVGNVLINVELVSEETCFGSANPIPIPLPPLGEIYKPLICQLEQFGSPTVNVIIPVSPDGPFPEVTVLNPEPNIPKYRIGVRLAHSSADLLTRYLRRGMFAEARETMNSNSMAAEQILSQKHKDPIAAVVGAYTLIRQNEIDGLHDWTSNLANWFEWLPDGAAVLGEHQARLGNHSDALAAFLLLNERGLPFFCEGLSYALERLRLYTRNEKVANQFEVGKVAAGKLLLERLQSFGTYTDFDRVALTYTGLHPTSPSGSETSSPPNPSLPPAPAPEIISSQFSTPWSASMNQAAPAAPATTEVKFVFNGINGATGEYLQAPLSAKTLATIALSDSSFPVNAAAEPTHHFQDLNIKNEIKSLQYFGTRFGVAMDDLKEAGWGVLFAQGADPRIIQALRPLLEHRKRQAGKYYKEFTQGAGYAPNETKEQFLRRHKMGPGPADPEIVPYYILIVGDPETIPYEVQYQLDVQYAVGRIWFDTLDDYARYAQSVVLAETGKIALPRKAVVFGPTNPGDDATALSTNQLLLPLARVAAQKGSGSHWLVETVVGADATRARLSRHLGGEETPALLFTASHGMGFPLGDPRQPTDQGALLCQDWQGPTAGRVDRAHYFAAEDISDSARLAGMIGFHFACYGAGTPRLDDFAHRMARRPEAIAPRAFISPLPRRMLSHPSGGALAFVGHVERAWGCSIVWSDAGRQIQAFEDAMDALMRGLPIGHALESMNQRYADISSELGAELLQIRNGTKVVDDRTLATKWTSNNDARSYVIIGDPAVRLPLAAPGTAVPVRPPAGTIVIDDPVSPSFVRSSDKPVVPAAESAPPKPTRKTSRPRERTRPVVPATAHAALDIPLHLEIRISVGEPSRDSDRLVRRAAEAGGSGRDVDSFAIEIDPDYDNREGYDPSFLGGGSRKVPLPKLSDAQREDAAVVEGATGNGRYELKYHHYSVVMNAARRLAYFTAVNIDGESTEGPKRETDKWFYDPRISRENQVGNELYASNPFDRGHLVRRLDPAWGDDPEAIKQANDDTFHFTNCAPQHKGFNQGKQLWAGLEDYLLQKATDEERRMTVFTGPVFGEDDPEYRDIQVPKQYWKVAVVSRSGGKLAALGFIVDQEELLDDISFSPEDVARTYQVPIEQIERKTGLSFGRLSQLDAGAVDSFAVPSTAIHELTSFEQIVLPVPTSSPAPAPAAFNSLTPGFAFNPAAEIVDGTSFQYYLVAFHEDGRERNDHPAGLISSAVERALADPTVTDVMLMSHGWQGDVPAAREQYTGWIRAMAANDADRQEIRRVRPGFKPLLVGIHWPSLEWGDESLATSFSAGAIPDDAGGVAYALGEPSLAAAVESYAAQLGDTPEARMKLWDTLRTVLESAAVADAGATTLPPNLIAAYQKLDAAVGLGHSGVGGDPGTDREPFDPEAIYQAASNSLQGAANQTVAFGGWFSKERILAPLRTLTYWKMKDRARTIGENAINPFLVRLQQITTGRNVRFHLVGHSFGCIVVSGAIAGKQPLPRPVASLTLLQGALSLWSCCDDIPYLRGTAGYYRPLISQQRVNGPIVTTRSSYDSAVGKWYPLASRVSGAVAFDAPGSFPKYGGVGTFGFQGTGLQITDMTMLDMNSRYVLGRKGAVTNVDASNVICNGGGISGAHSDIRKPEVAHLVWAAMIGEH